MSDEKTIIVDEDWKTRVAQEQAAARAAAERQQSATTTDAAPPSGGAGVASPADRRRHHQLPPASLDVLVTTLVTEAMVGLGYAPHPSSGKMAPDREQARYAIDMLEVLADKTKGNLSAEEEAGLHQALHQLRMAFLADAQQG